MMEPEKLVENAIEVLRAVTSKLPEKERNLRRYVYVKTTMGPPVTVELFARRKK